VRRPRGSSRYPKSRLFLLLLPSSPPPPPNQHIQVISLARARAHTLSRARAHTHASVTFVSSSFPSFYSGATE
jgi:hypothetical protein